MGATLIFSLEGLMRQCLGRQQEKGGKKCRLHCHFFDAKNRAISSESDGFSDVSGSGF
jgi:hypothetical protein